MSAPARVPGEAAPLDRCDGCGRDVLLPGKILCRDCWVVLSEELRRRLFWLWAKAVRAGERRFSMRYRAALREAVAYVREHRPAPVQLDLLGGDVGRVCPRHRDDS